jgi:hypothetical protein
MMPPQQRVWVQVAVVALVAGVVFVAWNPWGMLGPRTTQECLLQKLKEMTSNTAANMIARHA